MADWLQRQWVTYTFWHVFLLPISWFFASVVYLRCLLYKKEWLKSEKLPVPVVIVGNINVGGTGKTPLVIWLADQLQLAGYKPGIISRGYAGRVKHVEEVFFDSNPQQVGDEPVLIAQRTACPLFVSANRTLAGQSLLKAHPECNVIISDDGLQHYRLQRDVEIAVFDSTKGFGNQLLLPAGPLREPISRLSSIDLLVSNGRSGDFKQTVELDDLDIVEMNLRSKSFFNLVDPSIQVDIASFSGKKVVAIAGIGNPDRFFKQLTMMGLHFIAKAFSDHYVYTLDDLSSLQADVILMTEKDAVKCKRFAVESFWVMPVNAEITGDLMGPILKKLDALN
jgi:tetraacyldisaccharide 4'-kinase